MAAIPIGTGAAGYGIFKGVAALIKQRKLNNNKFDPIWEERLNNVDEESGLIENEDPQLVPVA